MLCRIGVHGKHGNHGKGFVRIFVCFVYFVVSKKHMHGLVFILFRLKIDSVVLLNQGGLEDAFGLAGGNGVHDGFGEVGEASRTCGRDELAIGDGGGIHVVVAKGFDKFRCGIAGGLAVTNHIGGG